MSNSRTDSRTNVVRTKPGVSIDLADRLDAQLVDLIEFVWVCERTARLQDRIDAAIKYRRQ